MGSISFSEQHNVAEAEALLILCVVINLVLLFTVLIAMLTDSFDKIVSQAPLYFVKDIFRIAGDDSLSPKPIRRPGMPEPSLRYHHKSSFRALHYPFSLIPGVFVLLCLRCSRPQSLPSINAALLRFPGYLLFWLPLSCIIIIVNFAIIPIVWGHQLYLKIELLSRPPLRPASTAESYPSQRHLTPLIILRPESSPPREHAMPRQSRWLRVAIIILHVVFGLFF